MRTKRKTTSVARRQPSGKATENLKSCGVRNTSSARKRSTRQEDFVDEPLCSIHSLNDDCMMHVFSFLSKNQLIGIERVCKRWKECSTQMWRSTPFLDFDWFNEDLLTTHILKQVLKRCGSNVQTLVLSPETQSGLVQTKLKMIAEKCPNLQYLSLGSFNLRSKLNNLYSIASQLKQIIFYECSLNDKDLNEFFPHCLELISLSLAYNNRLTSNSLHGLNSKVEELDIKGCDKIYRPPLVEHIARLKCLKNLTLSCGELKDADMLEDIFKNIPQLESLTMNLHRLSSLLSARNNVTPVLRAVSLLTGLVSLSLRDNDAVNDEVLRAISMNCKKIESLEISDSRFDSHSVNFNITDIGIKYVAQMPKLVELNMNILDELSDQSLVFLAEHGRLKRLECAMCSTFTDFGYSRLMSMSDELEHFDIGHSNKVTMDTVIAANASVKLRTNGVSLTLDIRGSGINKDLLPDDIDPQLHLLL